MASDWTLVEYRRGRYIKVTTEGVYLGRATEAEVVAWFAAQGWLDPALAPEPPSDREELPATEPGPELPPSDSKARAWFAAQKSQLAATPEPESKPSPSESKARAWFAAQRSKSARTPEPGLPSDADRTSAPKSESESLFRELKGSDVPQAEVEPVPPGDAGPMAQEAENLPSEASTAESRQPTAEAEAPPLEEERVPLDVEELPLEAKALSSDATISEGNQPEVDTTAQPPPDTRHQPETKPATQPADVRRQSPGVEDRPSHVRKAAQHRPKAGPTTPPLDAKRQPLQAEDGPSQVRKAIQRQPKAEPPAPPSELEALPPDVEDLYSDDENLLPDLEDLPLDVEDLAPDFDVVDAGPERVLEGHSRRAGPATDRESGTMLNEAPAPANGRDQWLWVDPRQESGYNPSAFDLEAFLRRAVELFQSKSWTGGQKPGRLAVHPHLVADGLEPVAEALGLEVVSDPLVSPGTYRMGLAEPKNRDRS